MNKFKEIPSSLPVLIFSWLIAGLYISNVFFTSVNIHHVTAEKEFKFEAVHKFKLSGAESTEHSNGLSQILPVFSTKNFNSDLIDTSRIAELIYKAAYLNYIFISMSENMNFHSTDIVFPFHFFP